MHRSIPTLLLTSGILLTAAACGTAPGAGPTAGAASGPAVPTPAPAIAVTCEALSQVYQANMAPLAQALTEVTTDAKTTTQAQRAMANFATAVQDATKASTDAELRSDGQKAADQLRAKSKDAAFFKTIKSPADVDKTIGPALTEWLSPIQRHCA
ncbi:hypothetical protein [Actinoplanes sp. GCM10030250]|uniref:hypothetical protein n=1 Tax=Actinoplanes sp. GCM10030250 TaxID=3273376 RepID=UPI003612A150